MSWGENSQAGSTVPEHGLAPRVTADKHGVRFRELMRFVSIGISAFHGISLRVISGSIIATGAGLRVLLN